MQNPPGTFIVIEGSDGSGKATQFKLLTERLKAVGYDVEVFDFPQYDSPSSYFIKSYLKGDYGDTSTISPYTASLFYALDRYEAAPKIRKALESGKVVVANRYVGSNMAHQGSKFSSNVEQRSFFVWGDSLEFQLLGIPRPSMNIFLRVPADVSQKLIQERSKKTGTPLDGHELDINHLTKSVATYDLLCQLFPKDFKAINCVENGQMLSVPAINNLIWEQIKPTLPADHKRQGKDVTVSLSKPMVTKQTTVKIEPAALASNQAQTAQDLGSYSLLAVDSLLLDTSFSQVRTKDLWSAKNGYSYYIPQNLPANLSKKYKDGMKKLSDLHAQLEKLLNSYTKNKPDEVKAAAKQVLLAATPMSAKATVTAAYNKQTFKISLGVPATDLEELRNLQLQTHKLVHGKDPAVKQKPAAVPQLISQALSKIGDSSLYNSVADSDKPVRLADARPRNELDLLADCLFPYTSLPGNEIISEIDGWTYDQKAKTFRAAMMDFNPALSEATYKFDALADRADLQALILNGSIQNLQVQPITPRYGYEVPDILEKAGAEDQFLDCFDLSLELFSNFQDSSTPKLAPYGALQGHKLRWQFSIDAAAIAKMPDSVFRQAMLAKIAEVHPLICESINSQGHTSKSVATNRSGRQPKRRR